MPLNITIPPIESDATKARQPNPYRLISAYLTGKCDNSKSLAFKHMRAIKMGEICQV